MDRPPERKKPDRSGEVAVSEGSTVFLGRSVSMVLKLFYGKQEVKEFATTVYGLILLTIPFPFIVGWCVNG